MACHPEVYGATALAVLAARGLDPLWPRFCLACGRRLEPIAGPLHLCRACRGRLAPFAPASACRLCAGTLAGSRGHDPVCVGCATRPPPWARLLPVWRYQPPLEAVIRAWKFHGLDFLGPELARAALPWLEGRRPACELVVPMPIAWPRRLRRGYNQAEGLARELAAGLDRRFAPALRRRGLGRPQVGRRRRDRLRLGRSGFRVVPAAAVVGRSVLLVDDVLTTGATAWAASAALVAAGAARVEVLVVAWTPPDRVAGGWREGAKRLDRD